MLILDVNIITKSGLLVFNHTFTNSTSDEKVDIDIQAGLMTSILNVLRDTQRETVTAIRYRENYVVILYEGVLTYGLLPSTEYDNRLFRFLREVVLKFELMFTEELHRETVLNRSMFEPFRGIIQKLYSNYIYIDVQTLNHILSVMQDSTIVNYVVYETRFFHPVFSAIDASVISDNKENITQISREIIDFGINLNQDFSVGDLTYGGMLVSFIKTPNHLIILFNIGSHKNKSLFKSEVAKIRSDILFRLELEKKV